jgi:hypothetical protein
MQDLNSFIEEELAKHKPNLIGPDYGVCSCMGDKLTAVTMSTHLFNVEMEARKEHNDREFREGSNV